MIESSKEIKRDFSKIKNEKLCKRHYKPNRFLERVLREVINQE